MVSQKEYDRYMKIIREHAGYGPMEQDYRDAMNALALLVSAVRRLAGGKDDRVEKPMILVRREIKKLVKRLGKKEWIITSLEKEFMREALRQARSRERLMGISRESR